MVGVIVHFFKRNCHFSKVVYHYTFLYHSGVFVFLFVFFFSFFSFVFGHLWRHMSSQARGQIWIIFVTYATAMAKPDPLTHCAGLGIEPASWCCRDATDPVTALGEFLILLLLVIFILLGYS